MARYYIGITKDSGTRQLCYTSQPSPESYGGAYAAFWGPFPNKRTALVALKYGQNNPHMQQVSDVCRPVRNGLR